MPGGHDDKHWIASEHFWVIIPFISLLFYISKIYVNSDVSNLILYKDPYDVPIIKYN